MNFSVQMRVTKKRTKTCNPARRCAYRVGTGVNPSAQNYWITSRWCGVWHASHIPAPSVPTFQTLLTFPHFVNKFIAWKSRLPLAEDRNKWPNSLKEMRLPATSSEPCATFFRVIKRTCDTMETDTENTAKTANKISIFKLFPPSNVRK